MQPALMKMRSAAMLVVIAMSVLASLQVAHLWRASVLPLDRDGGTAGALPGATMYMVEFIMVAVVIPVMLVMIAMPVAAPLQAADL